MTAETPKLQTRASLGLAALAVIAIVAGLILGGGPMQARKERRDETRLDDLTRLSTHIGCLAIKGDTVVMPASLETTDGCPGPVRLTDPYTNAPYRVEPLPEGRYRLCAGFELPPEATRTRWSPGRRDGDCVVESLPAPRSQRAAPDYTAEPEALPEPQVRP